MQDTAFFALPNFVYIFEIPSVSRILYHNPLYKIYFFCYTITK